VHNHLSKYGTFDEQQQCERDFAEETPSGDGDGRKVRTTVDQEEEKA
jgi:hypothetical protein